jgi:serine/threonine protein kinase
LDNRADLYSLGATLFRLLAGRPPFVGEEPQDIAEQHVFDAPPDLRTFDTGAPEELIRIIHKLLLKDPSHRYQTASEVIEALESLLPRKREEPSKTQLPSPRPKSERRTRRSIRPRRKSKAKQRLAWVFVLVFGLMMVGMLVVLAMAIMSWS